MLSVRLDPETRRLLNRLARERRASRSEIVREGIRLLAERDQGSGSENPYEAIRDLIGTVHGGPSDLSERTGQKFHELLKRKRR